MTEERQPNTELRREVEIQELACAVEDYIRDRPEEECYEGLKTLIRAFAASILAEARIELEAAEQRGDEYKAALAEAVKERDELAAQVNHDCAFHDEIALAEARAQAFREAIGIVTSWGDECSGGSGREIVPSGPSKGQMYGQAYYNLAAALERAAEEGK